MIALCQQGCGLICLRAQVSSVTLTESALSSPRVAAAPGAAAPSRSTRVRSFFNRPAFHAALFAFGMSRYTGSKREPGKRERSRRCLLPLVTDESPECEQLMQRRPHSRSASTLTHTLTEWREEAASNRGRHGQKGNTPNSSYTSSSGPPFH